MLELEFSKVYTKFKLQFYKKIFSRFEAENSTLSAVETFSLEAIHAMGKPTINEFAMFTNISSQNAAYKVAQLVKKGYIKKVRSAVDKREYHLEVTAKFNDYYQMNNEYIHTVMQRIRKKYSKEEVKDLENLLHVMRKELMPEVELISEEKN